MLTPCIKKRIVTAMKKTTTLKVILLQAVVALPLLAVAQPAAEAPALERTPVALSLTLAPQVSPTVQPATLRETLLDARAVFAQSQPAIYQIRVIDEVTGEKSVIGSGFQVSADGLLATNYHVVSEAINKPDRYRVEYIDDQKNIGDLSVLDIDVIYDLAIARKTQATSATAFLPLGTDGHPKGERIYSMGNPHDLGMTIVEGTFNGLMERSPYEQMLISGSLNPGMSGGPTVDSRGQVTQWTLASSFSSSLSVS